MEHENKISEAAIGAAIEVHRALGLGLLEGVYEEALCRELDLRKIPFRRQVPVPIMYKGTRLASNLVLDLVVAEKVILELKAKEVVTEVDRAQTLSYLRLTGLKLGLVLNFHTVRMIDGVVRVVNNLDERYDF